MCKILSTDRIGCPSKYKPKQNGHIMNWGVIMAYIFLDESGDLGFNPAKRVSKYFIVTILAVNEKNKIEKTVKKIHASLRKKIKRLSGGVLHCYKEKPITRKRLLTMLANQQISIMTIYLNKKNVYTKLQDEKHVLYNYVVNILLDRIFHKKLLPVQEKITLIAAKRETNRFLNLNFASYLQNKVLQNHKVPITIQIKTPAEEKCLQAVDFVSWAIFKRYEDDNSDYYLIIKSKIVEEKVLFA